MNTPICDFLKKYASDDNIRLHMPGHKGLGDGCERYDLTEIDGADSLYEASGIIKESENNSSMLFSSRTFYSTEGSSLAIRAMLYLALYGKSGRTTVLAARNAHKVFVSAAALLDFDIEWLCGGSSYLACCVTKEEVAKRIDAMDKKPAAVYLTSPDYLGNIADVAGIAEACRERGVLLLVDNAHGAYLAFAEPSMHPISLGADMCADSAHKTLPCLTGAAYLHLADTVPESTAARAKSALALFGSTSPSYLILSSLDKANAYLDDGYRAKLGQFTKKLEALKKRLAEMGYDLVGNEPMKLTIAAKSYGYTGCELAAMLSKKGIVCEFCDPDFLVLMPTPEIRGEDMARLEDALGSIAKKAPITTAPPVMTAKERVISPREAVLSECEAIDVNEAEGRVLADITVGCPPAVPIVVSGERIDENAIEVFKYYGITKCSVVK